MDAIKLVYFHLRGRAEMIRLMLEAAGQEYEEERVQFGDWLQRKPGKTSHSFLPCVVNSTTSSCEFILSFLSLSRSWVPFMTLGILV